MTTAAGSWGTAVGLYRSNSGNIYVDTTSIFTLSGVSPINTTWQLAVDCDNDKMWFGINNTWMSSTASTGGNPSTGANPVLIRDFTGYKPLFGNYSNTMTVDFDSANWGYTAPTGFVELSQDNLSSTDQFISALVGSRTEMPLITICCLIVCVVCIKIFILMIWLMKLQMLTPYNNF